MESIPMLQIYLKTTVICPNYCRGCLHWSFTWLHIWWIFWKLYIMYMLG